MAARKAVHRKRESGGSAGGGGGGGRRRGGKMAYLSALDPLLAAALAANKGRLVGIKKCNLIL